MWNTNNPFFDIYEWSDQDYSLVDTPESEVTMPQQSLAEKKVKRVKNKTSRDIDKLIWLMQDQDLDTLDYIDVIRIKRHCSLHGYDTPEELESLYQEAIISEWINRSSPVENIVYKNILLHFPDAVQGIWLDGFEIDIFIPQLSLIIEVDGNFKRNIRRKQNRERNSMEKDSYMKETYSYDTLRFHSEKEILESNISRLITFIKRSFQ